MYVRTWKDTEMVATSDSSTSESASNERPDPTPSETGAAAAPDATEPPAAPPAPTTPPAAPAASTTSRRNRPVVSRGQVAAAISGVRERLAAIVWIVTVIAAVILVAGALLIALDANRNNDLVHHLVGWAGDLDGPFNNMFTFNGDNAATKEALVNWGLAAVAWLVGGKIISSVIRP